MRHLHTKAFTNHLHQFVSAVHHHKQPYHHRGREGQEEAGSRSQANFMWNGDPTNQYTGRRNYADGAGASTLEGMGYRYMFTFDGDQSLGVGVYSCDHIWFAYV